MPFAKKFLYIPLVVVGVLALLFIAFIVLVSLGGSRSSSSGGVSQGIPAGAPAPGGTVQFTNPLSSGGSVFDNLFAQRETSSVPSSNQPGSNNAQEGQLTQRKITKNGSLSLLVESAEDAAQRIQNIANDLQGFVSNSRVYEVSAGTKNGAVTIRVPSDKFEEAVAAIKELASKVEQEQITSADVTEQFVDLEARLTNLRAEEAQYLEIMNRAGSISDTLQVAQQLSRVRGQVEQLEGQLQFLARQVDMSTIQVSLTADSDVEVFGIRWRPLYIVKQEFRDMLEGLTWYINAMIAFVFWLPVLILWLGTSGIIFLVAWKLGRKVWRKFLKPQPTMLIQDQPASPSRRKIV
ncbi:MAG TPA: DUF4349 domain-containing protein [Candidatus Paceibacterota bacterium]|nr:DUF4349 domain-containing protein [Candidatus Paceibacterota bacterium]